ncbi:ethylene-responsive transcription factor ERF096-like [Neltuma alba]|uniref:ethylene-responsive transcription factor ERF096-like n=1 Tax=Neltuma alba TaxID=207710 RepID=UPI0010A4270D|nr:ethylene-responsive transcription factor ERF096-like [Prosopis alba]
MEVKTNQQAKYILLLRAWIKLGVRYQGVKVAMGQVCESRWRFRGRQSKGRVWLGTFDAVEETARAYDEAQAACCMRGSFAFLSFPNEYHPGSNIATSSSSAPLRSRHEVLKYLDDKLLEELLD